jgi:hypothetical protein
VCARIGKSDDILAPPKVEDRIGQNEMCGLWRYLYILETIEEGEKLIDLLRKNKVHFDEAEEERITNTTSRNSIQDSNEIDCPPQFSFFRRGDMWEIGKCGEEVSIKNIKGMVYIHYLIENCGKRVSSLPLYHSGASESYDLLAAFRTGKTPPKSNKIDAKSKQVARKAIK